MVKRMKLISEAEYEKFLLQKKAKLPEDLTSRTYVDTQNQASHVLDLDSIPDDIKVALFNSLAATAKAKLNNWKDKQAGNKVAAVGTQTDIETKSVCVQANRPKPGKAVRTQTGQVDVGTVGTQTEQNQALEPKDEHLILKLDEKYHAAARKIFEILKGHPSFINWNQAGICSFNGFELPGSNIVQLVHFALRSRAKLKEPVGGKQFLGILKTLNLPPTIAGVTLRKNVKGTTTTAPQERNYFSSWLNFIPEVPEEIELSSDSE
jgi:hypothetical protein